MSDVANAVRGEAQVMVAGVAHLLRPSFAALMRAEAEIGPLFGFIERAAGGEAKLGEIVALVWHCIAAPGDLSREKLGEAIAEAGLAAITPVLKALVTQILKGR